MQRIEDLQTHGLRFIQDTRKAAGLDVSDRIRLTYAAEPAIAMAIEANRKRIMRDALIVEMNAGADGEYETEIEGYSLAV